MTREDQVEKILDELEEEFAKANMPVNDKLTLFAKVSNAIYKCAEQELCTDCISRKTVAEILNHQRFGISKMSWDIISEKLSELPPVKPTEKVGRWVAQDIHNCHTDFRCSKCGYIHDFMHLYGKPTADYTYCPSCGAKMEVGE